MATRYSKAIKNVYSMTMDMIVKKTNASISKHLLIHDCLHIIIMHYHGTINCIKQLNLSLVVSLVN